MPYHFADPVYSIAIPLLSDMYQFEFAIALFIFGIVFLYLNERNCTCLKESTLNEEIQIKQSRENSEMNTSPFALQGRAYLIQTSLYISKLQLLISAKWSFERER